MSPSSLDEYHYERLTWVEINEAVEDEKIIVVPVGSTEDHGHHLPLDVDQVIPTAICEHTIRDRNDTLLFPTVSQGYLPHHMDFPGGITIEADTFVDQLIDIGNSLTHHGFDKILFVNGHGSNHHLVEQASRQIILQTPEAQAAMLSWWEIEPLRDTARSIRDSGPTGSGHGGELETSIYMNLHPDRVDMDAARKDIFYPESRHFYNVDLIGEKEVGASTSVTMQEWWSTISETGVLGDATTASAEKGEEFLAAAVAGLHEILDEFAEYPIRDIDDKHSSPKSSCSYDRFRPR